MRAPQKTGGKMKRERRRPPSTHCPTAGKFIFWKNFRCKRLDKYHAWPPYTRCATSDSIKAAFMVACEAGNLEKVFNLNHWCRYMRIQIPLTHIGIIQYNLGKARAAIVLGVDVNMKAEKSRYPSLIIKIERQSFVTDHLGPIFLIATMIVIRRTALVTAVMKNNRKLFDLLFEQVGLVLCKYQIAIKSVWYQMSN